MRAHLQRAGAAASPRGHSRAATGRTPASGRRQRGIALEPQRRGVSSPSVTGAAASPRPRGPRQTREPSGYGSVDQKNDKTEASAPWHRRALVALAACVVASAAVAGVSKVDTGISFYILGKKAKPPGEVTVNEVDGYLGPCPDPKTQAWTGQVDHATQDPICTTDCGYYEESTGWTCNCGQPHSFSAATTRTGVSETGVTSHRLDCCKNCGGHSEYMKAGESGCLEWGEGRECLEPGKRCCDAAPNGQFLSKFRFDGYDHNGKMRRRGKTNPRGADATRPPPAGC